MNEHSGGRAVAGSAPGESSTGTEYERYLKIDSLLSLQHPLTKGAHDEMLFVIIHQVYELWFKLILHELGAARDAMLANRLSAATGPLERTRRVFELLINQIGVLETMSPDGFMRFRDPLAPASGFESFQFREIEALMGLDIANYAATMAGEAHREQLAVRRREPTIYHALCQSMASAGLDMPPGDEDRDRRLESLVAIYRDHTHPERALIHNVCETLLDIDEALSRWRFHHAQMAAREIGRRPGTGGSPGVPYLESTLTRRCFPELWELRSRL